MTWLPVLVVGLSAAALLDVWRLPRHQVPGPPALVWTALVVALPGLGAAVWLLARHLQHAGAEAPAPAGGPLGPDDDPEFLRSLNPRHGEDA